MIPFYLSLGANIDNRLENLKQAVRMLRETEGMELKAISNIYETEPVGFVDQPSFLNMVVGGRTRLAPESLLEAVLDIERRLGRVREVRWGPRSIDIDILTYGQLAMQKENLDIPHPRMKERLFVLIPLAEIAEDLLIPVGADQFLTPVQLLENVKDKSGVKKWMNSDWETELEHIEN